MFKICLINKSTVFQPSIKYAESFFFPMIKHLGVINDWINKNNYPAWEGRLNSKSFIFLSRSEIFVWSFTKWAFWSPERGPSLNLQAIKKVTVIKYSSNTLLICIFQLLKIFIIYIVKYLLKHAFWKMINLHLSLT